MTPKEEVEVFSRLGGQFEKWLDMQQTDAVKYLTSAGDPMAIYRAQGKALLIEEMRKLLIAGKNLR